MDSFKFLYLETCGTLNILRCEKFLARLSDSGTSNLLNLIGMQLTSDTCKALGQALSKDVHIKELDFSNCLLPDEGLLNILSGLEKNKFLVSLNLKGNNIRSSGTEAIGKFFRHNQHLQTLCLEWNGLGIFPEKFALFCEGLCVNNSLKSLDLRNNQLNHLCAHSLSDAISRNSSLQKLDLRWNNIGLTGGRAIFKALSRNNYIFYLATSGNDLPSELQDAIELATSSSAQRYLANNEHISRSKFLASKLEEKEQERNIQVKSLMEQLEKKDKDITMNEKWNLKILSQADEALATKDKMCEALTEKIQELEAELQSLSEKKCNLNLSLNCLQIKNKELVEENQSILNTATKNKEKREKELLEQIESFKDENNLLKKKVQELKVLKHSSEEEILQLKENLEKLDKISKEEKSLLKEQMAKMNEKYTENLKDIEETHKKEVLSLNEEFIEKIKNLNQKLSLLQARKEELEKDLKEKNVQLLSEQSQCEEMQIHLEKKLKSDHDLIRQQLEERIEMLEDANKEQYDHLQEDLRVMHKLKTDITSLDLSLAEQDHEIEHLKKLIEQRDNEMKAQESKIRLEVKEQLEELQKAKEIIQLHKDEISLLKSTIKEVEKTQKEELGMKNKTIQDLKSEIHGHQTKIKELFDEETKRTAQLKNAFDMYLKSGTHNQNSLHYDISQISKLEEKSTD